MLTCTQGMRASGRSSARGLASSVFKGGAAAEFTSLVAADGSGESYFSLALRGTAGTIAIRSQGER